MTSFVKRFVHVGGCELHYIEGGAGPPAVFLHGGGGHRWDDRTFQPLAQHVRLLLPSAPGFDASTPGTTDTIEDVADVIAAFVRELAPRGSAIIIGESFGGYVASWLAIRHPQVVDRLVLAAPSGLRQEGTKHPSRMNPTDLHAALFGDAHVPHPTPAQAEQRRRNRENSARVSRSRAEFDQALYDRLPEITAPTLVLWGTADRVVSPSQARFYRERISRVRLEILEGGPHALSAAVPQLFVPPILAFLAQGERYLHVGADGVEQGLEGTARS